MPERSRVPEGPRHLADGDPPPWWRSLDRRRLAVAMGTTLLALPILIVDNLPTASNSASAVETVADDEPVTTAPGPPPAPSATVVVTTTVAPTTTTATTAASATTSPPSTAPPTTSPPTTVAPPVEVVAVAAPTPPPAAAPANEEHGKATWYHWNPGECAHKTLPRGTVVTVTAVATGATTTCTVTDRGPYGAGRIIDLDSTVFDDLASLGTGVIDVVITW